MTTQQHATDKAALDGGVWDAQRLSSTVLVEHSTDTHREGPTDVLGKGDSGIESYVHTALSHTTTISLLK